MANSRVAAGLWLRASAKPCAAARIATIQLVLSRATVAVSLRRGFRSSWCLAESADIVGGQAGSGAKSPIISPALLRAYSPLFPRKRWRNLEPSFAYCWVPILKRISHIWERLRASPL